MTTTVFRKPSLRPSSSLLRHHGGKCFVAGLFLVILCLGQFDNLTRFLTGTERTWSASTVAGLQKPKPPRHEPVASERSVLRVWTLFRGMMDLALEATPAAAKVDAEDQQLERLLREAEFQDATWQGQAEELRRRLERGALQEEELHKLLAPLIQGATQSARPERR